MASVLDVAAYILKRVGPITATKLQKLVYYSQAWHLVWEDEPLFGAALESKMRLGRTAQQKLFSRSTDAFDYCRKIAIARAP